MSLSSLASAKASHFEPFAYLRGLLVQLSRNSSPAVAALLPDAWQVTHPEAPPDAYIFDE